MTHTEFRSRRRSLNLSQMDVARLSNVHRSTISLFEKHGIPLSEEQLRRLEAALQYRRVTDPVPINSIPAERSAP